MVRHKFVFVIPTLSMGGAERIVSVLGNTLCRNGQDVTVIKYLDCEDEYKTVPEVKIINLSGGGRAEYDRMSFLVKIRKLRSAIRQESPDYVLPFLFQVARDVFFATLGLPFTVIQSIRIDPASGPASRYMRAFRDWLVYRSKCTFVQNEQQRAYFRKGQGKIHVLYNPVESSYFDLQPAYNSDRFRICAIGRVERQKNFRLLVDAFCRAFPEDGTAELDIYGDGSLKGELINDIAARGREGSIHLKGRTDRIPEVLTTSDLFVLSSDFEGMPNALIEAMAAGLPCISTDCPTGPSDLITDGVNGLLVPVRDVEAMAEAMRRLSRNPESGREMGRRAKETIARLCDADSIAKGMIQIVEAI